MKRRANTLQQLYAFLLLAAISISVLPVKLLHRHEGERLAISSNHTDQPERFTAGDQGSCPVCLYAFLHQYLAGDARQPVLTQLPSDYSIPGTIAHSAAQPVFCALRGPPSC